MAWLNNPDDTRQAWRHRSQKPPFRRKNLADISYTDQVIANFVQNFVAMATGVGQGKTQLAARTYRLKLFKAVTDQTFDSVSLKTVKTRLFSDQLSSFDST